MSNSSNTKVTEQLSSDFFSADEKIVLEALSRCRDEGSNALIEPLIQLYIRTESPVVRNESADILQSLKVANAEEPFMAALMNPDLRSARKDLVSFMWNSGLQPVGWLMEFTNMVVDGTLDEVIECITLVESIEDEFPEEHILDSIEELRKYLASAPADDKSNLVAAYLGVLEQRNQD